MTVTNYIIIKDKIILFNSLPMEKQKNISEQLNRTALEAVGYHEVEKSESEHNIAL